MPFTDKDGHLTKAFQKEKHDGKSIAKGIFEEKLESWWFKNLLQ